MLETHKKVTNFNQLQAWLPYIRDLHWPMKSPPCYIAIHKDIFSSQLHLLKLFILNLIFLIWSFYLSSIHMLPPVNRHIWWKFKRERADSSRYNKMTLNGTTVKSNKLVTLVCNFYTIEANIIAGMASWCTVTAMDQTEIGQFTVN